MLVLSSAARAQQSFTCAPTNISSYSWNSAAGTVSETHVATGEYEDFFSLMGASDGGNVLVTAFNSGGTHNRCNVDYWGRSLGTAQVHVRCYDPSGNLVDNDHDVSFAKGQFLNANSAYCWNDTQSASSTCSSTYSYNSSGGTNTISHDGTGQYTVTFPGVWDSTNHGIVEVTEQDDNTNTSGKYCKVGQYYNSGSTNTYVNVLCFDHSGSATDARFTVAYSAVSPMAGRSGAWGVADTPGDTIAYTPMYYRNYFDNCGGPIANGSLTFQKVATGQYKVVISNLSSNLSGVTSHVQVTAYSNSINSTNPNYCIVQSWTGNSPVTAHVYCFDQTGAAADTEFLFSFTNSDYSTVC